MLERNARHAIRMPGTLFFVVGYRSGSCDVVNAWPKDFCDMCCILNTFLRLPALGARQVSKLDSGDPGWEGRCVRNSAMRPKRTQKYLNRLVYQLNSLYSSQKLMSNSSSEAHADAHSSILIAGLQPLLSAPSKTRTASFTNSGS